MIASGLQGVEFVFANTDAQALTSQASRIIQMGPQVTHRPAKNGGPLH
jgi:cell division protein FtsZ